MTTTRKRKPTTARRKPATRRRVSRGLSGTQVDAVQAKWLERGMWLAGGIGVLGAGYLVVKKTYTALIKEPVRVKQINESAVVGTPAYFASQFELAFHPSGKKWVSDYVGDGTDEVKVLALLKMIPSRNIYEQMLKSYSIQTDGRKFGDDLKDEMTSLWGNSDYDSALSIISKYR